MCSTVALWFILTEAFYPNLHLAGVFILIHQWLVSLFCGLKIRFITSRNCKFREAFYPPRTQGKEEQCGLCSHYWLPLRPFISQRNLGAHCGFFQKRSFPMCSTVALWFILTKAFYPSLHLAGVFIIIHQWLISLFCGLEIHFIASRNCKFREARFHSSFITHNSAF
ncbi:hypothetical protein CLV48_11052 [Cecembia rubra]|uniref:Uncharacterized protein n=1 Tax=Cecembia rubra TaxID=1485585 RepID=A0A2P8DYH2_9BACT|nr:hypothetical protein CLV48_11052 [Cecembia rubra]